MFGVEDFNPLRRTLRYTITDFFSYVGGLLGLFAGISVLSFFEVVYFFSLRILSNCLNIFVLKKVPKPVLIVVKPAK